MYKYLFIGDMQIRWYTIWGNVATIALFLFNVLHFKQKSEFLSAIFDTFKCFFQKTLRINTKFRFLKRNYFWSFVEQVIFSAIQYAPAIFLNPLFAKFFNTGANYFGTLFIVPFILLCSYWILGTAPRQQTDLLAPAFPFALIFTKLACFCQGCCQGIECEIGMFNYKTSAVEFPVQLLESGSALLIFIILLLYRKKAKPGTLMPLYTILYSALRFCSEFLRHEENVFGPLKTYHLLCIAGLIIGIIEYILVCRFGEKLDHFILTKNLPSLISNLKIKIKLLKKKKRKAAKKKKTSQQTQKSSPKEASNTQK